MGQIIVIAVYIFVVTTVLGLVFTMFKTHFRWNDLILASSLSALAMLIPTAGGPISLVILIYLLNLRVEAKLAPDIIVAAAVARLAVVPALLLI